MYFDEDLLLDVRLNTLNKYVNKFVISESLYTHNGSKKKLNFDISKFSKYKEKIIYIVVENEPPNILKISENDSDEKKGKKLILNGMARDYYQRENLHKGLENANNNDLVLISDLDEIPNLKKLKNFKKKMRFAVFEQLHFYYKFNLKSQINPHWYGSRVCVKKFLKSPQWLRDLKFKKRPFWRIDKLRLNNIISDGGWHFCNLKDPEKILYKYKNLCETDDPIVFNEKIEKKYLDIEEIKKRINNGFDIIGRSEKYLPTKLDNKFPKHILENREKYSNWIINLEN